MTWREISKEYLCDTDIPSMKFCQYMNRLSHKSRSWSFCGSTAQCAHTTQSLPNEIVQAPTVGPSCQRHSPNDQCPCSQSIEAAYCKPGPLIGW